MKTYGVDSAGPTVVAISISFGLMTFVVLSLRLFARIYVVRAVGADDILIVIAGLLSWAFIAVSILATQHGLGSHFRFVPPTELSPYLQIVWLSSIFYNACLGFIKASVLALYIRLGDRGLQKQAVVMLVVVACQASSNVLVCIFQCDPIQKVWVPKFSDGHCVNINVFYIVNAGLNILTDCLTYVLPIGLLRRLQIPLKQKIGVGVMLCLGFFTCLSSIVRITFVPALLFSIDPTYAITNAMYWSVIETNVGILAASIPSFKPLAKRYLPRLVGESASGRYKSGKELSAKSSGQNTTCSHSVFVEFGENCRGHRGSCDFTMNSLYGQPVGNDTSCNSGRGEHEASIASSDEITLPPAGKILAKTRISVRSNGTYLVSI